MKAFGFGATDTEMDAVFNTFDADGGGNLSCARRAERARGDLARPFARALSPAFATANVLTPSPAPRSRRTKSVKKQAKFQAAVPKQAAFSAESAGKLRLDFSDRMHSSADPKRFRGAREKLVCPMSLDPVIVAMDTTGSMGDWPKVVFDKLPVVCRAGAWGRDAVAQRSGIRPPLRMR